MSSRHPWKITSAAFVCSVIAWSLLAIGSTSAELAHAYYLEEMVRSSDTIVIARTDDIAHLASPAGALQVHLTVLKTITGTDIASAISLTVVPKGLGIPLGVIGSTRILFLKHENGDLQLSNVGYDTLPAVIGPPSTASDFLGAVIAEEGEVIRSPNSSVSEKMEAIHTLGSCKDLRTIPALNRALNDTLDDVRLQAVSRLAGKGDVNAIRIAQQELVAPTRSSLDSVIMNLQVGIRDGARTPATAPEVVKLLQVSDKATREAAADALSYVSSNSLIEPFRQALNDPDREVRYFAVVWLARLTGEKEHMPNMITFRSNEDQYTNFWRQWQPPE